MLRRRSPSRSLAIVVALPALVALLAYVAALAYIAALAYVAAPALLALSAPAPPVSAGDGYRVRVVPDESARRVDVVVDDAPFTSYIYPATLKKPVLYPLRSAGGAIVTRGWPLDPRPGERVDHPHQVGFWLNHGDVNGFDFWNNSDAIGPDRAPKMGTITHRRIVEAKSGAERGELAVEADWLTPDATTLLREETRFVFSGSTGLRSVERFTKLTALGRRVVFTDNKEGLVGFRVARALELPADAPEVFTDASGRATSVPVLDNAGVTGMYESSEGLTGDAVWGTRARWVALRGTVQSEPIALVMLDQPQNPGFPTYWHARGYGLFAANPLGQKVFSKGKEALDLTLEPEQSVTFRYQLLIVSGSATREWIEDKYRTFSTRP